MNFKERLAFKKKLIRTALGEVRADLVLNNCRLVAQLGCRIPAPYMLLSFISLPTVPDFGLTNKGLIDVRNHALISTLL